MDLHHVIPETSPTKSDSTTTTKRPFDAHDLDSPSSAKRFLPATASLSGPFLLTSFGCDDGTDVEHFPSVGPTRQCEENGTLCQPEICCDPLVIRDDLELPTNHEQLSRLDGGKESENESNPSLSVVSNGEVDGTALPNDSGINFRGPDKIPNDLVDCPKISKESLDDPDVTAWLRVNFREDARSLLSRELVFGMYLQFADENQKPLMNPACLGKAMRRVFAVTKTRRLGKRGDSKYHYSGIDLLMKDGQDQMSSAVVPVVVASGKDVSNQTEDTNEFLNCRSITGEQIKVRRKKRRNKSGFTLDNDIVVWLKNNFRSNPLSVIPRDFVFKKYRQLCASLGKTVMNPACFGKTLRGVFAKMETRRLGSRGNSKYHYAGIEVNPGGDFVGQSFSRIIRRHKTRKCSSKNEQPLADHVDPHQDLLDVMKIIKSLINGSSDAPSQEGSLMPDYLKRKSSWADISTAYSQTSAASSPTGGSDVDDFFCYFRIHIAMICHAFISGAFFVLPQIFENFWMTRTKSLQVSGGYSRYKFERLTALPAVQNVVHSCYLTAYDLLLRRLLPSMSSDICAQLSSLLLDFHNKFPSWIQAVTLEMANFDMRTVVCSAAAVFAGQLENLTRLHRLKSEFCQMDKIAEEAFALHCLNYLKTTLDQSNQATHPQLYRAITIVHCMLEQPPDLIRFDEIARRSTNAEFQRLAEQFCGSRLIREKMDFLSASRTAWHDTFSIFEGDNQFAHLLVTSWQIRLNLFLARETAALQPALPKDPILIAQVKVEDHKVDVADCPAPSGVLSTANDRLLNIFAENNVTSFDCFNALSLHFFRESADLRHCLDAAGKMIPLDFRETDEPV